MLALHDEMAESQHQADSKGPLLGPLLGHRYFNQVQACIAKMTAKMEESENSVLRRKFEDDCLEEARVASVMADGVGVGVVNMLGTPNSFAFYADSETWNDHTWGTLRFLLFMDKADGDLTSNVAWEYLNTVDGLKNVEGQLDNKFKSMTDKCCVCFDTKPENVLYRQGRDGQLDVFLADFGGHYCYQWGGGERKQEENLFGGLTPTQEQADALLNLMKVTFSFQMSARANGYSWDESTRRTSGELTMCFFGDACLRVMHGLLAVAEHDRTYALVDPLDPLDPLDPPKDAFVDLLKDTKRRNVSLYMLRMYTQQGNGSRLLEDGVGELGKLLNSKKAGMYLPDSVKENLDIVSYCYEVAYVLDKLTPEDNERVVQVYYNGTRRPVNDPDGAPGAKHQRMREPSAS